ncbi:origin recognition complex subunit [Xylariales sp. AK1849]|nr:origin recognition complex subunit [Xylariales sp. AK1849]
MARGKQAEPVTASGASRSSRKRTRQEDEVEVEVESVVNEVPAKRKRGRPSAASLLEKAMAKEHRSAYDFPSDHDVDDESTGASLAAPAGSTTPQRRNKRIAALGSDSAVANGDSATPRRRREAAKDVAETPSLTRGTGNGETPSWRRNDRSARKKSARALIERVVTGNASDEDDDQDIARAIYESSEDDDDVEAEDNDDVPDQGTLEGTAATPSKRPRGRPKKGTTTRARKKSPTPPRDLPPHEMYFAQNRPGTSKTSGNSLASLQLLTHEEYFSILHEYKDPHVDDVEFLQSWHAESFPQWAFELSQGFSICIYGFGSKRPLLHKFAKHVYSATTDRRKSKIIIINGYVRNTSIREVLGTVGSAVDSSYKLPAGNPSAMLENVKALLSSHEIHVTIVLHSIDAAPLRKSGMQAILAQLASHPQLQFICSADTPDFSLLWDSGLRSAFDFVFHDCTTFAPFTAEIDVVDDVHELLGRKARRVGGKEGVTYVLRSLPENAKNLFRLLVGEVLVAMDDDSISISENPGVEYRMLYGKAVEEFICSSEVAFRTLLKEFHDHQMIASRKDVLGTELLSVPFRKEELEAILEDLMS